MCSADNWFYHVSWYVLFEPLGRHDINKIEINKWINVKEFPILGRICHMISKKFSQETLTSPYFVLYRYLMLSYFMMAYVGILIKK